MDKFDSLLAWRLANADGTSLFQETPQSVGETYVLPQKAFPICVGSRGFHGADTPLRALVCVMCACQRFGWFLERVRLSGDLAFGTDEHIGIIASSERTTLWRSDAKNALLLFAADCAERAYATQPGYVPSAPHASQQWLAEGAICDVRDFVRGDLSEDYIAQFHNAMVRPGWHDAPIGEKYALKAAYHALYACYELAKERDLSLHHISLCTLMASDAMGAANAKSHDDHVKFWTAERDWQCQMLHERLMALAPSNYEEATTNG